MDKCYICFMYDSSYFCGVKPLVTRMIISLFLCIGGNAYLQAQNELPPAKAPSAFGADANLTLDVRQGQPGTLKRIPVYDFVKFNPRFRSTVPLKRKCSTIEMEEDRKAKHGGESGEEFERWIGQRTQVGRNLRIKGINDIHVIPVVVHVIYSNSTENISKGQIETQITSLTQDYRRRNPDAVNTPAAFAGVAADCQIEFCLASIDPEGRPTNGIDRISIAGAPFRDRFINEVIKPNTIWDPTRYMNIWVCNIAGGILGFAQFPSSSGLSGIPNDPGAENTDGVVIHYNAFGTTGTASAPFDRGRTATHEVGHWLGLRHVWGDGPCDVDDFCGDTPQTSDPNFNCPTGRTGCFGQAMIQNFMDYTDDACMNIFTKDQRRRMRAVLESAPRRASLLRSNVCSTENSLPVAAFKADITFGCGPLSVQFTEMAQGNPNEFTWSFPGGTPATSSDRNPRITYATAGVFPVSLVVGNKAGKSPALLREGYIKVTTEGATVPVAADFETNEVPPTQFLLFDPQGEKGWAHTQRVGGKGASTGAFWFDNYDNNLLGSHDWLISPVIDLSQSEKTILSFDVSYATFSETYSDTLLVMINTDCGTRYQTIYRRGGQQLATAEAFNRPYTPFPDEWRTEVIDLKKYDGEEFVQIAFVNISGYGNNLYLDNIRIAAKTKPLPATDFIALDPVVCEGNTIQFKDLSKNAVKSLSWTFPGGVPASSTDKSPKITYPKAGIYDVILTATNATGNKTLVREGLITVKEGPAVEVPKVVNMCKGNSKEITAKGALVYEWAPKKGLDVHIGERVTASPKVSTTYTLTAIGSAGCASTRTVKVQVNEASSFEVSPATATVCDGQAVELTAAGAGSYTWSPATGLNKTTGAKVSAKPTETTTYTVIGKNDDGCEFTKSVMVKVEDAPQVFAQAERNNICPGEEVRIHAVGANNFQWTTDVGNETFEGEELLVTPIETTTYTVSAGPIGCNASTKVKVSVKPKPAIKSLKDSYQVCLGSTIDLHVTGAAEFQWLPAPGLLIRKGASVPVSPRQSTLYTVIGHNREGCTDTATFKVTVSKPIDLSVSVSNPTICPGMQAVLSAEGATSYYWSPSFGLNSNRAAEVIARPTQSTTYTLTATDDFGCKARQQVTVFVGSNQPPIANFAVAQQTVCAGEVIQFVDRSRGASNFSWSFPGGTPSTSTEQRPKVIYSQPGRYDVMLRIEGCAGIDEVFRAGYIQVVRPGNLQIADSVLTICKGDTAILTASGLMEYRWTPIEGLNSFVGAKVAASPLEGLTYTVEGIDENGCQQAAKVRVTVRGTGQEARIRSMTSSICAGESIRLKAGGAEDYVWYGIGSEVVGVGEEVIISPDQTTTYRMEAKDAYGCSSTDNVTVAVKDAPVVSLQTSATMVCQDEEITLTASGALEYEWEPFDLFENPTGESVTTKLDKTTTFKVLGIDGFGCEAYAEATVQVSSGESLFIDADKLTLCAGERTKIVVSGGETYQWSPAIGLDTTEGFRVMASPTVTTTYTVTSTDRASCPAIANITIEVSPPKPLVITPLTQEICPGTSLELTASGATGEYLWTTEAGTFNASGAKTNVNPATTTIYTVRSTDSLGCLMEGSATISVKAGNGLTLAASAASVCTGDDLTLNVSGGDQYQWLPVAGLDPRAAGPQALARPTATTTYKVVGKDDAGCLDTAALEVHVTEIQPGFISSSDEVDLAMEDGVVNFTDRSEGGATAWEWEFGDGGNSSQQNPVHIFTQEGTFEVTLTVSNGVCTDEFSQTLKVTNSSDLEELVDESGIRVFPAKTTTGAVTLEIEASQPLLFKFRLLNTEGSIVLHDLLEVPEGTFTQSFDLSFFPKGTYVLQITDGEGTFSKEIVYE